MAALAAAAIHIYSIINIIAPATALAPTLLDIDEDFVLSLSLQDFTDPKSNQSTIFH